MKRFVLLFLSIFLFLSGYSQIWKLKRFEVWGGVSVFQYFGDIGGSADGSNLFGIKDISLKSNRPGINIGGTYRVNERIYIHGSNSLGFFAQTDKGSRNSSRNFAFYSIADELSVQGAFYILKEKTNYYYSIMGMRGLKNLNRPLSLYAFVGAGGLFFKVTPKEDLIGSSRLVDSKWVTVTFPVGLGLKFAYSPELSLGMELGARATLTDYLDGFTSSLSKHNDLYYLLNFKVIYRLAKGKGLRQQLFRK
jgi:opacity protein-like surface antigen